MAPPPTLCASREREGLPCRDRLQRKSIALGGVAGERTSAGRLLVALALLLVLCGCGGAPNQVASIRIRHTRVWRVLPDRARIPAPRGVALGLEGEVYLLDTAARVQVYGPDGEVRRHWRMPESEVGSPEDLTALPDGRIVVPDTHYHRVITFDRDGVELARFGEFGRELGQFIYPVCAVVDDEGNMFVCEYGSNDRIQKFTPDGVPLLAFGGFGTEPGRFQRPSGMVWLDGRLYVADAANNRVQVFSGDGGFVGVMTDPSGLSPALRFPYDITLGPEGRLLVVEWGGGRVTELSRDGTVLGRYGTAGAGDGQFSTPWGIECDSSGGGRIWVADTGNRRLVVLDREGDRG